MPSKLMAMGILDVTPEPIVTRLTGDADEAWHGKEITPGKTISGWPGKPREFAT